jgi:hypothetical protein
MRARYRQRHKPARDPILAVCLPLNALERRKMYRFDDDYLSQRAGGALRQQLTRRLNPVG